MSTIWLKSLIVLWLLCNAAHRFQTGHLYQEQPRAAGWAIFCKYLHFVELTMLQFIAGSITCAFMLKFYKNTAIVLPMLNQKFFILVVFGHITGTLALNAALSMHSVSIQRILTSFEPLVVFCLLLPNGLNSRSPTNSYMLFGLILVSAGGYMLRKRQENLLFSPWGFATAVLPLLMFPLRNVYLKAFDDSWKDPVEKYLAVSISGFLVLSPLVILKLAFTRILPLLNLTKTLQSIVFHVVDSLISIYFLEIFSPIYHSILGTLLRYSIFLVTVTYFAVAISCQMTVGIILFLCGIGLFYQKWSSPHGLRRFIISGLFALHLVFGANVLRSSKLGESMDTTTRQPFSLVHTFWVYNKPPSRDILNNMQRVYLGSSRTKLHVFCGTFSCMKTVKGLKNPRVLSRLLRSNDFGRNSPLEQWFREHALNKIISGNDFENHLHEATRLALLWNYGGILVDLLLGISRPSFQEHEIQGTWLTRIKNSSTEMLIAFRLRKHHPLVKILGNIFVKLHHKSCYLTANSEKFLPNFHAQSMKAFVDFCSKGNHNCREIVAKQMHPNKDTHSRHDAHVIFKEKNYARRLRIGTENVAMIQFFPFMGNFMTINGHFTSTKNVGTKTSRFIKPFRSITFPETPLPKNYSSGFLASLRENGPVACVDVTTVNFLRSQNVDAYLSGGLGILMKSPFSLVTRRKNIYLVNLDRRFIKDLPSEILENGVRLSLGVASSLRVLFKSMFVYLEKIFAARLVITGDLHCASLAAAFNTPVILVRTQANNEPRLFNVFHTWDPKNTSTNATRVLISRLLSGKVAAVANIGLFMTLRATTWNVIRRHDFVRESALKFGVVPFTRPSSNKGESLVFHLIFTTSKQSLISLENSRSRQVTGGFAWRHWRCIESIFYHHPLATVIIHSNTLPPRIFSVLTESGYDVQVKGYSLVELASGTPAEVFVRDELVYAREGRHWYSHETDLLRLLILYKFGGIYMDVDMIVVRDLNDLPDNVIGWESNQNLNGAFLKFKETHPYLYACLKQFSERYSQAWSDNGPLLLSRVWREWSTENPENDVTTVSRNAFYVFFYRNIEGECFEETSGMTFDQNWKILRREAFAVHLYSKVTAAHGNNGEKIKDGTLCKYILNAFCVLCNKMY